MTQTDFDPDNPTCPHCKLSLKDREIDRICYKDLQCTMIIWQCRCGAKGGYVVMDTPKPNDSYVIQRIVSNDRNN